MSSRAVTGRMTRWRAVFVGVVLACCSESLVFLATGRVTLVGGVAGSALAGYLAGDDLAEGAWHGMLGALAWGTILIPTIVVLTLTADATLPFPFEYVLPLVDSTSEATTALMLGVTLPNVVAGAAGSAVRWRLSPSVLP